MLEYSSYLSMERGLSSRIRSTRTWAGAQTRGTFELTNEVSGRRGAHGFATPPPEGNCCTPSPPRHTAKSIRRCRSLLLVQCSSCCRHRARPQSGRVRRARERERSESERKREANDPINVVPTESLRASSFNTRAMAPKKAQREKWFRLHSFQFQTTT